MKASTISSNNDSSTIPYGVTAHASASVRYPHLRNELLRHQLDTGIRLNYSGSFQLLIAAILLAQSTEEIVNNVTPKLFATYPTPQVMASADRRKIEAMIRPTGFQRQKAKYLYLTSQMLLTHYRGEIPNDMVALTKLPGVARKTANFVMGELHGRTEGVIVDMRVRRAAARLQLAQGKSAEAIENQLMRVIPEEDWLEFPQLLMDHADNYCTTSKPLCHHCPLANLCPSSGQNKVTS